MSLKNIPFTVIDNPPPPPSRIGRVSPLRAAIEALQVGQALSVVVNNQSDQSSARSMAHLAAKKTGGRFVTSLRKINETEVQVMIWRTA